MREMFRRFSEAAAHAVGTHWAFLAACLTIAVWAASGSYFGYSDTWQLFINTGTTIVTFLMVFLIQNTQNRDTAALQIKLDELIRINGRATNVLLDLEELDEEAIEKLRSRYQKLAAKARGNGESARPERGVR